jgi:preprotein translocase subunit SecG
VYLFVVAVHILLCVLLVLVIILQPGKGGDMGAAFGGGAATTLFGPQGPTNLLQQATTGVAFGFMVTSITLAWFSSRSTLANANVEDELLRLQQERDAAGLVVPAEAGMDAAPTELPAPSGQVAPSDQPDGSSPAPEAPAEASPPVAPAE